MATAILHSRHFNTHNFEEVQPIPQWIKDKYQPNQYLWVLMDLSVSPVFALFDHDNGKVTIYSDVKKIDENKSDSSYREINENDEPLATIKFIPMDELKEFIMLFKNFVIVPHFAIEYGFPYFNFRSAAGDTDNDYQITPTMLVKANTINYRTLYGHVEINTKMNLFRLLANQFELTFSSSQLINKKLKVDFIGERSFTVSTYQFSYIPTFDDDAIVFSVKDQESKSGFTHGIKGDNVNAQIWYLRLFEKLIVEYIKDNEGFYQKVKDHIDNDTDVKDWFDEEEFY